MNRKGQALIEFILILPVFLMILLTIVDFGNILNSKNKLENTSTDIARLIKNEETISKIQTEYPNLTINVTEDNNYKKIKIEQKVKILTPFLDRIIGNPYIINSERIIPKKEINNNET